MDLADPNIPLSREVDPAASVLGLAPFAILVLHVQVDRCRAAHGGLHVPVEGNGVDPVWLHLNLFYIERGFYCRMEVGEREIDGSTVHIMGAVGNKTLFGCLPLPPLLLT
jgi:hypothetical protein